MTKYHTYTIFVGSVAWDEVRATNDVEALAIARSRQTSQRDAVWVRKQGA